MICVIDAARPDHMGCYGYPRETTPNLDRLAAESLVFEQHFCQAPFTHASTASPFSSQYPDTHLIGVSRGMAESTFTMAQGLNEAGFETALFSSVPWAAPALGVGIKFQEAYQHSEIGEAGERGETWRSPEPLFRLFGNWVEEHRGSRFFTYVHFVPPHRPYEQPEEMTALFEGQEPPNYVPEKYHLGEYEFAVEGMRDVPALPEWINLYDANLRYADWAVGEVERVLREQDVLENTVFIVTSDHGEAFGEHGYALHQGVPYDEATHIALIVRLPGGEAVARINTLTQTIDLLPTIFDLFDIPCPNEGIQGRSLLPLIAGETDKVNDYVFVRALKDGNLSGDQAKYMVRGERYALLLYANGKWRALYDLETDPEQRHNIIDEQPERADELIQVFAAFADTQRQGIMYFADPTVTMPPVRRPETESLRELRKELKRINRELEALGYVR